MFTIDSKARGPIWALLFDAILILASVIAAFRTGNISYLLIAIGLLLLTVTWYLNPIPLNSPIKAGTRNQRFEKMGATFCVIGGGFFMIMGLIKLFF